MAYGLLEKTGLYVFVLPAISYSRSAFASFYLLSAISHTPYALRFRDTVDGWQGFPLVKCEM